MQLEVTSQVWGHPNSLYSDYLFTGGGSPFVEEKTFRRGKSIRSSPAGLGWASAWIMRPDKAERACNLFSRKARRLCENLDVDPIGQRISLVSFDMKSAGSQHTLDFLDLRAPSMQSVHHQDLPRFTNGGGQVLSASFSPDGIFWACARDDNTAHVWDSRFMNRDGNPMRILSHGPGLDPKDAYGVTAMTWINHHGSSSRPVLVTGGDDGRILEWDIRTARPRVVATLETSVGYFTIGDVYKNEMPLVAWDDVYKTELDNFEADSNDEGEVWFGVDSVEKMVDWTKINVPGSTNPYILDIGAGNGILSIALADAGYNASRILGVDYSADSVRLAKAVAQHRGVPNLMFERGDFLKEDLPLLDGMNDVGAWDLLLDKGMYDAIALAEKDSEGVSPLTLYPGRVKRLLKPGAYFLITSCNFTEDELKERFAPENTDLQYQ
ncbi:hypothetical protein FRB97_007575 [Tulasnella sp. 331]|nr:hypothetical protein FRB97_007575 [Tulasnella sp. 331]